MKKLTDFELVCHWDENRKCERGYLCGGCESQPADDDKPNGRKEPVPIRWQDDYGMMMPYCPSCGEMAYSTERCTFCGQKLINEGEPETKREIIGGKADEDGIITCDDCGNYDSMEVVSHTDGRDFYDWTYKCGRCGKLITVRTYLHGERW